MKKSLFLLLSIAFVTLTASSQDRFKGWTVKAGANFSTITEAANVDLDYSYKAGFTAGVSLGWGFTDVVGLSVDVLFSNQGATMKIPRTDITITENSNYINIPVMANFFITEGLTGKAGAQLSYFLSANDKVTGAHETQNIDIISDYRTMDVSIPIGIEYAFKFGLAIEVRYNFGLTDMIKESPQYPNMKSYNSYGSLTLGYKF